MSRRIAAQPTGMRLHEMARIFVDQASRHALAGRSGVVVEEAERLEPLVLLAPINLPQTAPLGPLNTLALGTTSPAALLGW